LLKKVPALIICLPVQAPEQAQVPLPASRRQEQVQVPVQEPGPEPVQSPEREQEPLPSSGILSSAPGKVPLSV
jgi:hypothetical protein